MTDKDNELDFIRNFNIFYFNLVKEVKKYRINKEEFYLSIATKAVAEGMKESGPEYTFVK